jgi:hypothetical protein
MAAAYTKMTVLPSSADNNVLERFEISMKTALLMLECDRGWFLATLYRGRQRAGRH